MPELPDQAESADELLNKESDEEARLKAKRKRARRVLLTALLVILGGLGVSGIWPWLLPAFIYEGPMLQMAGEHEVTLVWYMTRPVGDGLSVHIGEGQPTFTVESDGRRCRATLTGLAAGQAYPYTITLGRRTLAQAELRTNQPAGEPFTFISFGDSGRATKEQYVLAAQMTAVDPDFILHTGDLVYGKGERRHYKRRFFEPYGDLIQRVNFWPCIGNHDVFEPVDESPYFAVFEVPRNGPPNVSPEHNYWFDYGSARIVVVNGELDEAVLHDRVAPWLRTVLGQADSRWKFVAFHRPPYTGGAYGPDEKPQRSLVPVIEETGVDLVFNGHDHMYQRTHPIRNGVLAEDGDGPAYIITGAGGAMLYEPIPPEQRPDYMATLHHEIHSFTLVYVAEDELTLEQIALGGEILDRWTLHKTTQPEQQP